MQLRQISVGCFGGGTGMPALLGGLKRNPWLSVHAVVTMFDSGGSSGQLRDELGVLPPGDVLKCALALARNEAEARRVLLSRVPSIDPRLAGHTGGNLLLSMMQQYSGDFLAAVDALRALLGCRGRVWPVSVERATLCAEYADGAVTRGEVEVDAAHNRGPAVQDLLGGGGLAGVTRAPTSTRRLLRSSTSEFRLSTSIQRSRVLFAVLATALHVSHVDASHHRAALAVAAARAASPRLAIRGQLWDVTRDSPCPLRLAEEKSLVRKRTSTKWNGAGRWWGTQDCEG